ncbi:BamA/TamA family outer membrane protein [Hymenobacter endophyticus]|uniref:BamA/TamA family outer membrane protein n=1 Tax=Hymenobacter endophyticus TaxID=3076335 RepID=A0ABU3TMK3_9BACT|nr:BamA/TamA family outer membrane protein [Hymenobacter endophyticus]MDU0372609.1 BamA/TamA family outer membrane protein [Hymenobacter endophyticus]
MRFFYPLLALGALAAPAAQAQLVASATPESSDLLASVSPVAVEDSISEGAPLGLNRALAPQKTAKLKLTPDDPDKPSFIPVPIAFYQQETGFAGGAAILPVWRFGQDTTVRKSNARLIAWISQEKQTTVQLTHTIFTKEEKFYFSGELSYYDLAFKYYGRGNDTQKADEVPIQYPLWVFDEKALKKVLPNLFVGVRYRLTDLGEVKRKGEEGKTETYTQIDSDQRKGYVTSGVGPALLFDSRDNVLATYTGNFVDAHVLFAGKGLGSDYNFTRYMVDARHFRPLFGSNNTILALQFLGQYHTGEVPFREWGGMGATLGGSLYNNAYLMRGIYEARYRDRQFTTAQAEIRQKLFWRIDGAVFGAVGEVAPAIDEYTFDGLKFAGGVGARFRFNRRDRLNIRLDYGVGSGGNSGIIFAVGEAF